MSYRDYLPSSAAVQQTARVGAYAETIAAVSIHAQRAPWLSRYVSQGTPGVAFALSATIYAVFQLVNTYGIQQAEKWVKQKIEDSSFESFKANGKYRQWVSGEKVTAICNVAKIVLVAAAVIAAAFYGTKYVPNAANYVSGQFTPGQIAAALLVSIATIKVDPAPAV